MTISEVAPTASAPAAGALVFDVTDATFREAVVDRSHQTGVVVDLWAPWCGPCVQLGPLLEQAVLEAGGLVVLAKVNVDENPRISQQFSVQSIPAVYGLYGGRVVDSFIGAQGAEKVRSFVEALKPSPEQQKIAQLLDRGDE